jgi:hypothetical protein
MAAGNRNRAGHEAWTKEEALAILEECRASGLSRPVFAARKGVRVQRLYWWAAKLAKAKAGLARRPEERSLPIAAKPTLQFVPAIIKRRRERREPKPTDSGPVVVHAGTARIEITEPSEVSPAWVAALVRELGRPGCS